MHPPGTKILLMFSEGYMYLKYEMGCPHRSFRGKTNFLKRFLRVGENAQFLYIRNNGLYYSRSWPRVPLELQCILILTFGLDYMILGLPKNVCAVFSFVVS